MVVVRSGGVNNSSSAYMHAHPQEGPWAAAESGGSPAERVAATLGPPFNPGDCTAARGGEEQQALQNSPEKPEVRRRATITHRASVSSSPSSE